MLTVINAALVEQAYKLLNNNRTAAIKDLNIEFDCEMETITLVNCETLVVLAVEEYK